MAADLGQQTVEFSSLVRRAAEESYLSLKELVETCKTPQERSDSEKKIDLLKFIVKTRQRMLRLHVLSKWCLQVPLIQYCQQLAATLSSHDTCFTQTADSLFYMHEGLQQARAPIFDVPSAVEVLLTGGYSRIPKCIEDLGFQSALDEDLQKPALKKLEMVLRSKLLDVPIPKEISEVTVTDGAAALIVNGEFKIILTLGYRGHLSLWRILHLELLVGEKYQPIKLEETRRYALGDDLERRMAAAENPFLIMYTILHELCVSLVMDTVLRQVKILRQGRWKDAIRFELISDSLTGQGVSSSSAQVVQDTEYDSTTQKIPGLKIIYWLDWARNPTASDSGSSPFIKIEPGQDLQIKCLHSTFVFDPVTEKEAELTLQLSCIDVEKLLLRAIICNRHTRLLDIQRELRKNVHICQAPTDVILKREGDKTDSFSWKKEGEPSIHGFYGDEVLQVRVYGSSYIRLRINIRNGRFLFQCSKNILATSALLECEEAINLGSMTATDLFISLRSKSILHLFASIGRSLGLKVYENCLGTLKIPKSILLGSDLLLLGFPQCGNSYFLLMQLDKDFRPFFNLLETHPESGGKLPSTSDSIHVIRLNKIDISRMQIGDDDLNLSLLNWEKMRTLPNIANLNQLSENVLPESALEHNLQLPDCSQTSFSSIVDEVFESEKDTSGNQVSGQSFPSSFSVPAFSHLSSLSTNNQGIVAGVGSPKLDGGIQNSQMSTFNEVSASLNSTFYLSGNAKGQLNSGVFSSSSMRNPSFQKLTSSKSEQDLSTLKPPYSSEPGQFSALDDGQSKFISGSSGSSLVVKGQLMSPPRTTVSQDMIPISRINGSKGLSYSQLVGSVRNIGSSSLIISPSSRNLEFGTPHSLEVKDIAKQEKTTRKRSLSEILTMMPSFKELEWDGRPCKRIKTLESAISPALSAYASSKLGEHIYASLVAEAVHGNVPSNVYTSVLLHVVRHCSLCIKHARLTTQMESLEIPYVEEIGLRSSSSNLWFRLPFAQDGSWQHICLRLGKPGSMSWDVKIKDLHFQELWELYKGNNTTPWYPGVRIANASDVDSHIHYDSEGVILCYKTVEVDSIERLVSDLRRLSNARLFSRGMRRLISVKSDDKLDDSNLSSENKLQHQKSVSDPFDKLTEQMRRTFKIEAVGLMSLWFSYGSMPVMAHFVVEWEAGKEGCTMHVSPDHLWPHTKFLEDFINGGDVASFLDCIRLTAGPLLALAAAIPPARMSGPVSAGPSPASKQGGYVPSQGFLPNNSSIPNVVLPVSSAPSAGTSVAAPLTTHSMHNATASLSAAGRCVSGIVPSSLLPIDVSVVLRGPYWIRVIYRKKFAVDMRCFAGDQVWLQPATPPKGGPSIGGSLPCPQFRPFIMEHVAQGLNALEPNFSAAGHLSSSNTAQSSTAQSMAASGIRPGSVTTGVGMQRPVALIGNQIPGNLNRIGNNMLPTSGLSSSISGVPMRIAQGTGVPVHVRGELNTAFIGLGDDGGYGGGWVPLAALKKVLRGILKYLGVLWLFAQLPDLLKEILGSILKDSEGALLNLDQEQPALRFFVGGYVFAVSVHRVQLLLQVLSVKRFHHQQQQLTQASSQEELSPSEINEICDYFSRRVASEPYDASRVASFITLLTVPVLVLREFLKLIAWKKGLLSQPHGADMASAQRARIELCLENHSGTSSHHNENSESLSVSKSNIHHDRAHSSVDFALTFVLDPTHIPHINAAGGAAWLPYCVSVRLKYSYAENSFHISFLRTDGSHGGRACWSRADDWEKCKQRLARAVDYANGNSVGDISQGRLRLVAEALQRTLQASLQQLRDGSLSSASTLT